MKLQSRMLSLAVLAALPALALAANDTTALDQILVTATRTPIALQDSIAPAQVIDRARSNPARPLHCRNCCAAAPAST